jgi:hypothetical protein
LVHFGGGCNIGHKRDRLSGAKLVAQRFEALADVGSGQNTGQGHLGSAAIQSLEEVALQRGDAMLEQHLILLGFYPLHLLELDGVK